MIVAFAANRIYAKTLTREIDLSGIWLFEIGDDLNYAKPAYDDSKWSKVYVPSPWENEGFPGYDGYGWYRIKVIIPKHLENKLLYLKLGQIDDVDRTYINGNLLGGFGDFPPHYQTAYDKNRLYEIPAGFINYGKSNVITVRVYDYHHRGGIVYGDIGLYSQDDVLNLLVDLSGLWKFNTGNNEDWASPDFDDSGWRRIGVPSHWEQQGFPQYDGYAWYRKSFRIKKDKDRKLILVIGKIDDVDQVFINGISIGSTGEFPYGQDNFYSRFNRKRAYFIPPYLLNENKINTIAVKVYDHGEHGGIYSGHIGIVTRKEYLNYQQKE